MEEFCSMIPGPPGDVSRRRKLSTPNPKPWTPPLNAHLGRSQDHDLSTMVEEFCLATGGGIGSYFGADNCFALGVSPQPAG